MTPTEDVSDGQLLEVRVDLTDEQATIRGNGAMRICRAGVEYTRDTFLGGGNCPNVPFSTSGDIDNGEGGVSFLDRRTALGLGPLVPV